MRQTTTPDYYEVLGVPHDADAETIRKAFRAQAEARAATEFLRRRTPPVAEVLVDEFEAKRGVRRKVRWTRPEPCRVCGGDGAAPEAISMTCPGCVGTGRRRIESSLDAGERLLQIQRCPTCSGRGTLTSDPCNACHGSGQAEIKESAEVVVPAGATDGDRLRVGDRSRYVVVRLLAGPSDYAVVRWVAALGLLVALVFLWLLLR